MPSLVSVGNLWGFSWIFFFFKYPFGDFFRDLFFISHGIPLRSLQDSKRNLLWVSVKDSYSDYFLHRFFPRFFINSSEIFFIDFFWRFSWDSFSDSLQGSYGDSFRGTYIDLRRLFLFYFLSISSGIPPEICQRFLFLEEFTQDSSWHFRFTDFLQIPPNILS